MTAIGACPVAIETFLAAHRRMVAGETGLLGRDAIDPLRDVPSSSDLDPHRAQGTDALRRTVMIKLNGGLGTSMGLDTTKSLLPAKPGLTFLDVVIGQVLHVRRQAGVGLPLILMNSFNTEDETRASLRSNPEIAAGQPGIPVSFVQNRVPKIRADNGMPVDWPADRSREWCPPGHGDLYLSLRTSGLLASLLERGFEYAFVSNIDNLGATLNIPVLGYFAARRIPFLMEVTRRTDADRKGGHLARLKSGGLVLRELAQCPPDEEKDFQDIRTHRYFNTNNLWLNLRELQARIEASPGGIIELPLIVNRKTVDPTDAASPAVCQLETAMGAAISVFPGAEAVDVPRSRFAPVKTTEDLLGLWSDAYEMTPDFDLRLHPDRKGVPPVIKLDRAVYGTYAGLLAHIPKGAPSLRACASLTVEGDIVFGRNVTLRGRPHLRHSGEGQMLIPDNAEIEA